MLYSSLYTMVKLSETTSPHILFQSNCITLYIYISIIPRTTASTDAATPSLIQVQVQVPTYSTSCNYARWGSCPPPAKIFEFLTLKDAFLSRFSPFPPFPSFLFFPHTLIFYFFPQQPFPLHHHNILQNIYTCLQKNVFW